MATRYDNRVRLATEGGRSGLGIVPVGGGRGASASDVLFGIADTAQRFNEQDRREAVRREAAVVSRTLVDAETALLGFTTENEQDPDAFAKQWQSYSQRTLSQHRGELTPELESRLYGMGGKAEILLRADQQKRADEQAGAAHIANINRLADSLAQTARMTGGLEDADSQQGLADIDMMMVEVERLKQMNPGDALAFKVKLRERLAGQALAGQTEAIWRRQGYSAALAHAESALTVEMEGPKAKPAGQLETGNIDLHNRPVVKNADGSISTVRSMSFNEDGIEVLVPTVSDDGRIMADDEALETYRRTGRHLGKFDTPEHATAYAHDLHEEQDQEYRGGGRPTISPESRANMRDAAVARINELQNEQDRKRAEFERQQAKVRRENEAVIGAQLDVMIERGTDPSAYWNANKGRLDPVTRQVMGSRLEIAGIRRQRAIEELYAKRAAKEQEAAADRAFADTVIAAEKSFISDEPITTVELDAMQERGVFAGREGDYISLYRKAAGAWEDKAEALQKSIEEAVKLEQGEAITQLDTLIQDGKLTDPTELDRLRELGVFKGEDDKFLSMRARAVTAAKKAGEDAATMASFQAAFVSGSPLLPKAETAKAANVFMATRGIELGNDEHLPELADVIQRTGVVPQQVRDGFELAVTSRDPAQVGYWAKLFGALDGDPTSGAQLAGQLDDKTGSYWREMAAAAPVGRLDEVSEATYQRIFRGGSDSRVEREAERNQAASLSVAGEALRERVSNEFDSWLPLDEPAEDFASDPRLRVAFDQEMARRQAAGDNPDRAAKEAYRRVREVWGPTDLFGPSRMVEYPLEEWAQSPTGEASWALDQLAVELQETLVGGSVMDADRELAGLTAADFRDMIDDGRVRLRPTRSAALAVKGGAQAPSYVVEVDLPGGTETLGDGTIEGGWRPDWSAPTNPHKRIWDRAGMESAAIARQRRDQSAVATVGQALTGGPGLFRQDQRSQYYRLLQNSAVYDETLARVHGDRLTTRMAKLAKKAGAPIEAVRKHIAGP